MKSILAWSRKAFVFSGATAEAKNGELERVRTVIVDGRVVMKDRQFLTVDMERLRRKMNERYTVILDRFDKAIA